MRIRRVPIISIIIILCAALYTLPVILAYSPPPPPCNNTCGRTKMPFPFGFSPGCAIHLNCTQNGTASIGEFLVRDPPTPDAFDVVLPPKCGRSIDTVGQLYSRNYAPTSRNGILMRNCSSPAIDCKIPNTDVQTKIQWFNCSSAGGDEVSCYSEQNPEAQKFIDYANLRKSGCKSFFSAISTHYEMNSTAVSVEVQAIRLAWWLEGDCQCSDNANCTRIASPTTGGSGFRCQCLKGFAGDGFRAGSGCRKESSTCNPSRYISGKCGGTAQVGVLVGGIVAGACLMISMGLIFCFVRKRSATKTRKIAKRRLCEATGIKIPIYPYKEMERATNSFSEKQRLGTGAFGTVYSGKLHNNEWVAIKRIKQRDSTEQVMNEIKLISSVNHPNLVRLLGCSIDNGEQILVYEFMPNGTLSQHLQRERSDGLSWPVRLNIASETAQAIAYLHNAMNPPIYHRDVKSSNILLDYDFKSKVADFGLSRLGLTESSHVSTAPQGTPGYLDPQYHQNFQLSDKSDVYSFGVVLVEIITGLKAVDFARPQTDVNLAALAVDRIGKGLLEEIIDPTLEPYRDAWTITSVQKVAEIAFRCLAFHQDMRPSMMEVAVELEQVRLSRFASLEENNINLTSSKSSFCSSVSNLSEKPLKMMIKKPELDDGDLLPLRFGDNSMSSTDKTNDFSSVSLQDSWLSGQSSPTSSNLLSHAI